MERYRRGGKQTNKDNTPVSFKDKLIKQTVISIVIFALVFVIGLLKTETAQNFSERIKSSISYTVDYKASVQGIIKRISNLTNGVENEPEKSDKTN